MTARAFEDSTASATSGSRDTRQLRHVRSVRARPPAPGNRAPMSWAPGTQEPDRPACSLTRPARNSPKTGTPEYTDCYRQALIDNVDAVAGAIDIIEQAGLLTCVASSGSHRRCRWLSARPVWSIGSRAGSSARRITVRPLERRSISRSSNAVCVDHPLGCRRCSRERHRSE